MFGAALGPIRPSGELPFVSAACSQELIVRRAEGYTLRYLLEEDRPPEQVEQRLTQEFVARYAPGAKYTKMAASGFLDHQCDVWGLRERLEDR